MASTMSSYSIVVSGLRSAQVGLNTTGHNISNSGATGYTRQQNIQTDFKYQTIGSSNCNSGILQLGLGTDVAEIRQIRNKFLDIKYRTANASANFYQAKAETGEEIEAIFGELETDYKTQEIFEDVWKCINDLTVYPDGLETRSNFIQTCNTFVTKVQNVADTLLSYQLNLNEQVKDAVNRINSIVKQIDVLNEEISYYESGGLNANDYRDERNLLLDELSTYMEITVKEDRNGTIQILSEGKELLANGAVQNIGLKYSSDEYPFVIPVFTDSEEILPYSDKDARELYPTLDSDVLSVESDNTNGKLKGLLISRGNTVANYTTSDEETGNYLIPKIQKKFDTLVNSVVTLLNDAVSPLTGEKPADLNGDRTGLEIFVRTSGYDRATKPEDEDDYYSLYTTNNIEVNPLLLEASGYNLLCISPSGDPGDTSLLNDLSTKWKEGIEKLDNLSVDTFYTQFVTDFGVEIEEAKNYSSVQGDTVTITDNQRLEISGVSLDEELTTMLKYQYAYQSAAKMLNVIDSMIDKIVNQMV